MSGCQAPEHVADGKRDQRCDNRLRLDHVAKLGCCLLRLAACLIIEALGLGFGVARHIADGFLYTATELAGYTLNTIVHCYLLPNMVIGKRSGALRVPKHETGCRTAESLYDGGMQTPDIEPNALAGDLAAQGYATRPLLAAETCRALAGLYDQDSRFRKRIVMEQHAYGRGEYKYFAYPLPDPIATLRTALYPPLAVVANAWRRTLGEGETFPDTLEAYLARCHAAGQTKPTPLMLRYGAGGFNCLHQDLYGDLVFPLQVVVLLNAPGEDFTGGEFMMVEQRPRAQSRGMVVPLRLGEAVIFPVHHRPGIGTRGPYRLTMRHGVSRIHSGRRNTLGIIFHDAA
jgi:hypothetical protein